MRSAREVTSWSVELGDGDLALIRYTQYIDEDAPEPDAEALDAAVVEMVRGWAPAVEAELIEAAGAARATRLALTYIPALPRRLSRPHRAGGRRRRHPAAVRARRRWRPRGPDLAARRRDPPASCGSRPIAAAALIPLSDAVPVLENFGFRVLEEMPTALAGGARLHPRFPRRDRRRSRHRARSCARLGEIERAIANVLCGVAEDDEFNQLVLYAGLDTQPVVWLRAWFRYLRQTGSSFGLVTVVDALRRAPNATRALIGLFVAAHDPAAKTAHASRSINARTSSTARSPRFARSTTTASCAGCAHWSKRSSAPTRSRRRPTKRSPSRSTPSLVPGLPAPVPWREIWVYSPRVEGIHLRGGPVARGGLRWSDRRDDFRTEILGLMKAQLVKNAVIVPTGAKGGFYPKQLPPIVQPRRLAGGGHRKLPIFIRSLLSITDNLVNDKVVHPARVVIHDGDDPYFVVAADKGTATFSDIANAIALERNFWLGDAFASGGSNGYDHKAMGITAKGAWISVQRHFLEMGIDVQTDAVTVAGCGDMSGDVFGNGMLLSKSLQADRGVRPPPYLHRSQSRSGGELGGAQAPVRAAALELGRL